MKKAAPVEAASILRACGRYFRRSIFIESAPPMVASARGADLSGERTAAPASAGGVRIIEGEARTHDAVDVIDLNALQVLRAEHVDEDPQPARFDHLIIGLGRFFDVHRILETGASAGHDAHAQTALHSHIFRFEELLDLRSRRVSQGQNHCLTLLLNKSFRSSPVNQPCAYINSGSLSPLTQ